MPAKSQPRRGQPRARTAERHTYRPSAALRGVALSLIVLFGALAVVFAYFSTRSLLSTVFCALPIVLFFLLAVSYISYLARRTSLVLAASGLEYHTPNLSLRTSWENVERLGARARWRWPGGRARRAAAAVRLYARLAARSGSAALCPASLRLARTISSVIGLARCAF